MSFLSWFTSKKKPELQHSVMPSSGLSRLESTKPFNGTRQASTAQPANRKQERLARRELLYAVVREAMVRAGVLSSSYKFKVLSLDPRGRQFMVMVDLAQGSGSDTHRLAEIEAMIGQSAKARHDILISAVYWRANEHVAVGDPAQRAGHKPLISQPAPLTVMNGPRSSRPAPLAPLTPQVSRPAPLMAEPPARAVPPLRAVVNTPVPQRVDPIEADEVAAFQKALAAGVRGEQALAVVGENKLANDKGASYTLLTGFEDTEMTEGSDVVGDHLSGTQFGALR
jgi:hypothetical protein